MENTMDEVEVTINDTTVSATDLARWIHSVSGFPVRDSLHIARCLLRGETWRPTSISCIEENPFCNIVVVETDYEKTMREHHDVQHGYYVLMQKGAAGDVAAAIEYCKLELEGKVSHGAFA